MIYYIDRENGRGDGLSPDFPRPDYRDLELRPGDKVLFRRGTVMRERLETVSGEKGNPVVYGAYGEGEAPRFLGSVDLGGAGNWEMASPNIWRCVNRFDGAPASFRGRGISSTNAMDFPLKSCLARADFICGRRKIPRTPMGGSNALCSAVAISRTRDTISASRIFHLR